MKFRSIILSAAAAILSIAACQKPEEDLGEPNIELNKYELTVAEAGGSESITLNSTRAWKVNQSSLADWVAVSPDKGEASSKDQTVTIDVLKNDGKNRECVIEFNGGIKKAYLTVKQNGPGGEDSGIITVAEFIAKKDTENDYTLVGTLSGLANSSFKGFELTDATGTISVAFPTNFDTWVSKLANGGTVTVKGKYSYYEKKSQDQLANGEILDFVAGETPQGPDHSGSIYYNDFDKELATKTFGTNSDAWPYLDQFEGWKNQTGSGASAVEYEFAGSSVRNNSNSDGSYSDYQGSGKNNILFGSNAKFVVKKIALGGKTNLQLVFGTELYDNTNTTALFSYDTFPVYISKDGAKWVKIDYVFNGITKAGRWNTAEATFTVPSGTSELYIHIAPTQASVYRMDDLELKEAAAAGTAIDFSKGIDLDGGSGGDVTSVETEKIAEVLAAGDDSDIVLKNAVVVANAKYGYLVTDAANSYIYVYYKTASSAKTDPSETVPAVGSKVNITAKKSSYCSMGQLVDPTTTVLSTVTVTAPEAQDITSGFDSFTSTTVKYVKVTGKLSISGSYYNITVSGASSKIGAFVAPQFDVTALADVDGIVYEGYYIYTSSKYIYLILTKAERPAGAYFTVSPASVKVAAAAGTAQIKVSSNVAWTASSSNAEFTLDKAAGEGDATITVTCPENKAYEPRTVKVTVATTAEVATKSVEVEIVQAAAVDPSLTVLELTNEEILASFAASAQASNVYADWTIKSASGNWTGNMNTIKDCKYVQIRNTMGANVTTPVFDKAISKIEVTAYATTGNTLTTRKLYAVPMDTDLATANKDTKYGDAVIANAYAGPAEFKGNISATVTNTLEFTANDVKQCKIICKDGAFYITSIKVYLK